MEIFKIITLKLSENTNPNKYWIMGSYWNKSSVHL